MKRFIRVIVFTTAVAMLTLALSGCSGSSKESDKSEDEITKIKENVNKTGYPVVKEPVEINAFAYGEPGTGGWDEYPIFKEIAEKTGVNVKFETVSGDGASEKLNLKLASESNLPDVFFSGISSSKIAKYADIGLFVPMNDLIDEYAPNLKAIFEEFPKYKAAMTSPDGKIYSLGGMNAESSKVTTTMLYLNKDWLDKLGLEIPTTTEEFKKVLEAFKSKDPNGNGKADEIPFSYEPKPPYDIWNGDSAFSGAFGIVNGSSVMVKGDKLVFVPMEEGYKDYIKWTRDLYTNGLIDAELFTQDHNQYSSKMNSDNLGAFLASGAPKTVNWIAINPLEGPKGDKLWASYDYSVDRNRAIITSANDYPEATMRYLDSFYEEENTLKLKYGNALEAVGDNQYKLKVLPTGELAYSPGSYVPSYESQKIKDEILIPSQSQIESDEIYKRYEPFLADALPLMSFTPEESSEYSKVIVDIDSYVIQKKAEWTTGQSDIDADWDGYIETLKKMKIERAMEIYNESYHRFIEIK